MRTKRNSNNVDNELVIAIGLVWGHLNARQFEEAYFLAKGCMRVWPDNPALILMAAYAAAEHLEPVDYQRLALQRNLGSDEWIGMVLLRAGVQVGQS
ncbi:MAG: hypothetical protein V7642_277 [Burkholderiales bacterium]|jgi:hypothetical protein